MQKDSGDLLLTLAADIIAAHVSNNSVAVNDLPNLISSVHGALANLGSEQNLPDERADPKVSVRASVKPDYMVCLEDGKRMKMLKRHLMTDHQMTAEEYRMKWGLNSDYPMVAPNYAENRRTLAKSFGLGTKDRKTSKAK